MLKKLYSWFHGMISKPDERGEYSGGHWQDMVRREALAACGGIRGRLLEVGCGEGLFLAAVARANPGAEIYGVDNNMGRIILAKRRIDSFGLKNVTVLLQEAPVINFKDGYFDVAACLNVFYNMPSAEMMEETLAQMKRVCRTGGRIIFDFRNSRNLLIVLKYRFARYYDDTAKNLSLNTYAPGFIKDMVEGLGLEIVSEKPVGFRFKAFAPVIIVEARKI